jgi:hypothetical protein
MTEAQAVEYIKSFNIKKGRLKWRTKAEMLAASEAA